MIRNLFNNDNFVKIVITLIPAAATIIGSLFAYSAGLANADRKVELEIIRERKEMRGTELALFQKRCADMFELQKQLAETRESAYNVVEKDDFKLMQTPEKYRERLQNIANMLVTFLGPESKEYYDQRNKNLIHNKNMDAQGAFITSAKEAFHMELSSCNAPKAFPLK